MTNAEAIDWLKYAVPIRAVTNDEFSDYDQHTIDVFYKGSKPIAWMPLPKPWKGVENDT